ncbi:hypothetical protein GDO86_007991 [Hymenochirus boettgeri]|uniref:Uncharacterized protein n=1 Tax=Hymenochirus boettgeri TaxID=247094 RepID=A0A8T2IYT0_9PIPI|nr:hypothetical protein GDO86_007991 [Hymenochirus boettgeri]
MGKICLWFVIICVLSLWICISLFHLVVVNGSIDCIVVFRENRDYTCSLKCQCHSFIHIVHVFWTSTICLSSAKDIFNKMKIEGVCSKQ